MAWEAKAVGEKLSIPHSAPGTGTYTERSAYDLSTPNLLVKCDRSNLWVGGIYCISQLALHLLNHIREQPKKGISQYTSFR